MEESRAFTEKGLPKSALEEVKKIYTLAKAEKQDAQVIKALVYIDRPSNGNQGKQRSIFHYGNRKRDQR